MSKKVYVIRASRYEDAEYEEMFQEHGFEVMDWDSDSFEEADLLCFTGGTDIDSRIYNEDPHYATDLPDIGRDGAEVFAFNRALELGIPMVGICRGSQLLYALNGGKLNQDIRGHLGSHEALVWVDPNEEATEMVVTSSHHQQMKYDATLEGAVYLGQALGFDSEDAHLEVVLFPETKCLCHQPHPEWMEKDAPYRQYFFETVNNLFK